MWIPSLLLFRRRTAVSQRLKHSARTQSHIGEAMTPLEAWDSRPTGPLSNLYMTTEQTEAVHAWLGDVIAKAREDEAQRVLDKVGFDAGHTAATVAAIAAASNQRSKFKARDWDDAIDAVVAAIEALGDPPPLPPTTGRQHKY